MLSFGFFGFSLSLTAASFCDVRLYEHAHTTEGIKCTIHEGQHLHSLSGNPQGCPGNSQLSRVKVDGDCYVDLYHEAYYGGTHQRLWGSGDYAVTNAAHFANDAVKSVRVHRSSCSSGEYAVNGICRQCRVTLGQHMTSNHNNMGRWCEQYEGYSTWSFSSNNGCPGKNEVSYIKIEGPCEMELFEHNGYDGHDWVLPGPGTYYASFQNDANYENDEINSFKISLQNGRRRREADMNSDRVTIMLSEEDKAKAGLPSAPKWQGQETQLEVHRMDDDQEELERLENRVMQELEEQERELVREEERLAKTADRLFELEEREEAAAPGLHDDSSRAAPRAAGLLEKVRDYLSTHRSTTDDDDQE